MGNFTKELKPDHEQTYVLFGGGSGITPLLSILKSILRVETKSTIVLYYGNRDRASVMFAAELERLSAQYGERLRVIHVLDEATPADLAAGAIQGPVTDVIVRDVAGSYVSDGVGVEWFTCGPVGLMDTVIAGLHASGVDDHKIHREYFTLKKESTGTMENAGQSTAATDEVVTRQVRIRLYGQEHSFTVQPDETILSAAARENLDPPYACQIGACCTCRAKLVTGRVSMDEREALSDDEIAEGYVLTCQSHPLTDDVFADYDQ
jgi:ring-1,2-phenylacetyl-CoA epoxidase subunit PaaE